MPIFFDRFRAAISRYAEGVHELGDPATKAARKAAETRLHRPLPAGFDDLYISWDGLRLFTDSFVLEPLAKLTVEDERTLRLGEALGAPLIVDGDGRIYELDELGDRLLTGSSIERWLDATVAREGLLVERDGEWKDVFAAGEETLNPEVRKKRIRAGLKADPQSATWQLEAAELAFESGTLEDATKALELAVAADPGAGVAWELLGGLRRRDQRAADAEACFVRAAESTNDPVRRAERWAEAARAAGEAGRPAEAHARAALAADEKTISSWVADAEERLREGDLDGAANLSELLSAVKGGAADVAKLARDVRMRKALRLT
jgi:tetratricopeptide (TPR) repeat protein